MFRRKRYAHKERAYIHSTSGRVLGTRSGVCRWSMPNGRVLVDVANNNYTIHWQFNVDRSPRSRQRWLATGRCRHWLRRREQKPAAAGHVSAIGQFPSDGEGDDCEHLPPRWRRTRAVKLTVRIKTACLRPDVQTSLWLRDVNREFMT